METLAEEPWDLVIAGTELPQALLALSLSRSNLKILHVDKYHYYGGNDAGLSLDEAQQWATKGQVRSNALKPVSRESASTRLAASRAYTLNLNPQIIYASSLFLPSLVTSRLHNQLDFLAVGSFYTLRSDGIERIPSTREDVFADDSLSRRDKIGLMKLLRYIAQEDESADENDPAGELEIPLQTVLETKFKLSPALQKPISALALSQYPAITTKFGSAVSRMRQHLRSMNYFGPGFAAVYPKYAGNAEIAQTACRAGAVGGTVYLLGQGVASVESPEHEDDFVTLSLSNGTVIKARRVVGSIGDLPPDVVSGTRLASNSTVRQVRTIFILGDPLQSLFVQTSDSGPIPAVTIVLVDNESQSENPVYLQIHAEDTGECPSNQCCVYASTILTNDDDDMEKAEARLRLVVEQLLRTCRQSKDEETTSSSDDDDKSQNILWSMTYTSSAPAPETAPEQLIDELLDGHVIVLPTRCHDIALDDSILATVKTVWRRVVGDEADEDRFLVFEEKNLNDDQ